MKKVIRIIDNTKTGKGKVITHEITMRDYDHFQAQLHNKSHVFADKRKKDPKYKPNYLLSF